jgi:hypothetical protein
MAFTNLPPQAYTRDVLAAAYEWLRSQPASIRELATSSDNLVSLYMQSRRRPNAMSQLIPNSKNDSGGNSNAMSGAGAEAFKNDLKNLAEGLKQFEDHKSMMASAPPEYQPPAVEIPHVNQSTSTHHSAPSYSHVSQGISPQQTSTASQVTVTQVSTTQATLTLDARSLDTVRKVQSLFNLSNEREALRLLIAVGLEKVKEFTGG